RGHCFHHGATYGSVSLQQRLGNPGHLHLGIVIVRDHTAAQAGADTWYQCQAPSNQSRRDAFCCRHCLLPSGQETNYYIVHVSVFGLITQLPKTLLDNPLDWSSLCPSSRKALASRRDSQRDSCI